jgi:glycosyltransferase involved in cell wall biosynthesis
MTNICLSICIPTKGRLEILKNTLDSIYLDYGGNFEDFEVVLSDNSTDELLPQLLKSYKHFPNIVYEKTTSEGFLNSMNALKMGNGVFLKLHNDYTIFNKGTLTAMISFIKSEMTLKPLIFFSNYEKNKNNVATYDSFNSFAYELSFLNTWSTGFSIWKEDYHKLATANVNKIFPHTSLLLSQFYKKTFMVNDLLLFKNQEVNRKGGYNLFEAFAVQYLKMIEASCQNGHITNHTFNHIKKDLFDNFLVVWYYNTMIKKNQYTFNLEHIKSSVAVYYSKAGYYKMVVLAYKKALLKGVKRKILRLLKTKS